MTTRLAMALTAALVAQPVWAAEMAWHSSGDETGAELRYGTADKTETPISFWCTPYVDIVYVAYFFRPANATEAMETEFTLSAGGITIPVGAIGYNIEMDKSFVLEGQMSFDDEFVRFITSAGTLTATAEGKTEAFPLAGAKEKAGVLLEMCGRRGSGGATVLCIWLPVARRPSATSGFDQIAAANRASVI